MSVTITIRDNHDYCEQRGLIAYSRHQCICVCDECADGLCNVCKGSGIEVFAELPFELNLTNSNFSTFWTALGFPEEYEGEIDSRFIMRAIRCLDIRTVHREDVKDGNYTSFGIGSEQADRYVESLLKICKEAEKRESNIVWS